MDVFLYSFDMRVRHISFSTAGGAGTVATLLSEGQRRLGFDSEVVSAISSTLLEEPFTQPLTTAAAVIDSCIVSNRNSKTLFSLYRDKINAGIVLEGLANDFIHLHWTKGLLSTQSLIKLLGLAKNPVLWTLHDMQAFTGGCHHSHGCEQFQESCSACPQVHSMFASQVKRIHELKLTKKDLFENVRFIAPSEWMRDQAQKSHILRDSRIEVIENPVNDVFLNPAERLIAKKSLGITEVDFVALVVAADLADANKGVQLFVDDFFSACEIAQVRGLVLLIGRNGSKIEKSRGPVLDFGAKSPLEISRIGPAADLLGLYSQSETAPMVMVEAALMGLPTVFRPENKGAASLSTKLAQSFCSSNSFELSKHISVIAKPEFQHVRHSLAVSAKSRFASSIAIKKYLALYD